VAKANVVNEQPERQRLDSSFTTAWPERAATRAGYAGRPARTIRPAQKIVDAACSITAVKGSDFTITELAKEAGVSLQTFYRYFAGRDEVVLAVIEQRIAETCVLMRVEAQQQPDSLSRLRWYIASTIGRLQERIPAAPRRFAAAERYRLQEFFPAEIDRADEAFTRLLLPEIEACTKEGLLIPFDAESDARFVTQFILSIFHQHAFSNDPVPDDLAERVWEFCFRALGGRMAETADGTAADTNTGWGPLARLIPRFPA
jgi:TetR/AcrR family transcriptional regulator